MNDLLPVELAGWGVRLEPLEYRHQDELANAVRDGALWELWYTAVPHPAQVHEYITEALNGLTAGTMLPWAVREERSGVVIGSTRFHDVIAAINRVEIGYTWYAKSWQRTHINSACKLLLLGHAFDKLACDVVAFQTDRFNFRSQQAISALGARLDGTLRHSRARKDGTVRDTVYYSILASEWPEVRRHLEVRLARNQNHD